ncbi:hypothetical protein ATO12_12600 [Aquimarina atlantica]|uniref:Uncharacterized protein n=1 Tax=Aquimarina atlantica TaxID=1317122 RepID=A0A023BX71_9FLAO|nr:hypothetical protein [Aquimarina atlantica]EZH74600.1 hypothetical protein ATO12_12600 [Aquimarina atlantica]
MDKQLKEFYKDNEARIEEDFSRNPPIYYDSLSTALYHYFKTFKEKKDTYHLSLDFENNTRKSLSFHHSDVENATGCLNAFGRYFELFFKKMLQDCFPDRIFLFVKPKDAYKMFRKEIRRNASLGKYKFLLDDKICKDIQILIDWRNNLAHYGIIYPNNHALDFIVSQQVLPIVQQIYATDKISLNGFEPHYFKTKSGISIIKRISEIEFNFNDFNRKKKHDGLIWKLALLCHLKEMGRACHENCTQIEQNLSWYEPYYDDPVGRNERIAEGEKKRDDFYSIRKCPCCGVKSLVVYRKEIKNVFNFDITFISWFKCYTCTYEVKNNMGDPFDFGLFKSPVFPKD